jgi:hypothetical protein
MLALLLRFGSYVALAAATSPIVGAYDYGSAPGFRDSIWLRLLVSVIIAAVVAALGESALYLGRRLRRH